MRTPLVKAEQDRSIRVEDLAEVVMVGSRLRQSKERLVPLEAPAHIANANDRPRAPHGPLWRLSYQPRQTSNWLQAVHLSGAASPARHLSMVQRVLRLKRLRQSGLSISRA